MVNDAEPREMTPGAQTYVRPMESTEVPVESIKAAKDQQRAARDARTHSRRTSKAPPSELPSVHGHGECAHCRAHVPQSELLFDDVGIICAPCHEVLEVETGPTAPPAWRSAMKHAALAGPMWVAAASLWALDPTTRFIDGSLWLLVVFWMTIVLVRPGIVVYSAALARHAPLESQQAGATKLHVPLARVGLAVTVLPTLATWAFLARAWMHHLTNVDAHAQRGRRNHTRCGVGNRAGMGSRIRHLETWLGSSVPVHSSGVGTGGAHHR